MFGHIFVLLWLLLEASAVALAIGIAVWGFFRWDRRYRGAPDGDGFQPTGEIFKDPTTGRQMRVFFDSASGQRQYREI